MMSETKKLTGEHRKKISESRKGVKFTEKHKENLRRAKANASDFIVRTPHGDYPSFNEAGREIGISYKTIFNRCRNPKPKWKDWQVMSKEQHEKKKLEEWSAGFVKRKKAAREKQMEDLRKELEDFGRARVKGIREWRLAKLNKRKREDGDET